MPARTQCWCPWQDSYSHRGEDFEPLSLAVTEVSVPGITKKHTSSLFTQRSRRQIFGTALWGSTLPDRRPQGTMGAFPRYLVPAFSVPGDCGLLL